MNLGRKITGGKYHKFRKKKLFEGQGQEKLVVLGETKRKSRRVRGGRIKKILLKSNIVNVNVKGKVQKIAIKNVEETPQNKFLARQNLLVKGAIIDTSLGHVRITNRPSREGCINAVLVEK